MMPNKKDMYGKVAKKGAKKMAKKSAKKMATKAYGKKMK